MLKRKQKAIQKNVKNKLSDKNVSKIKPKSRSNTNSNESSLSKSYKKLKSKRKNKSKDNSGSKESTEKEKQIKIDNELIKKQYKIIKEFLTPILKEENARQLVSCYTKKIEKEKKKISKKNNNSSLNNRTILDYSFVNENKKNKRNKKSIPLFQILYPNQYKSYLDKKNKEKINKLNKMARHFSAPSSMINKKQVKEINKKISASKNNFNSNKIKNKNITKDINKNKGNKNLNVNDKSLTSSNNNNNRAKTPPLYLRINDVQKKHEEELEKLKKKYEYNFNSNKSNSTPSETDSYNSKNIYDFKKWYNYEQNWVKMKNIKISMIKDEIEENKMCVNKNEKNEETFKPQINEKSKMMANEKYDGDFYLRLKNYQEKKVRKRNILQKKLEPSFKPYVNTNYPIKSEYYAYMIYDQKLINRDLNYFLEHH